MFDVYGESIYILFMFEHDDFFREFSRKVYLRGMEVFEDRELLLAWMTTPNLAFNHQRPLDLLDSLHGTRVVLDELTRIEHGVFI